MKAIPMMFNQKMVQALVDGRKTVTRRPIRYFRDSAHWSLRIDENRLMQSLDGGAETPTGLSVPFKVGDLIWVRETFQAYVDDENEYLDADFKTGKGVTVSYPATDELVEIADMETGNSSCRKSPSIHMPRRASRLTLRVTDVRCEKVQQVTDYGAAKEGFSLSYKPSSSLSPLNRFKEVWNNIYKNWDENPWVWVIEFEVIHKNVDEVTA